MMEEGDVNRIVFVSYAIRDQDPDRWLDRLRVQVKPLELRYHFDLWDDSRIQPGQMWQPEIERALNRAAAAVLLVGPAFLGSDFIMRLELPRLLRRAKEEGLQILPLLTHHSNYEESKLAEFQAFKLPNQPLIPLEALPASDQNKYLKEFSLSIKRAVEEHPPPTSGRVRHNLLIKPTNVVGRGQEMQLVLSALEDDEKPVILASGFGGVGKSTVAKVVAWKCVERRQPFKFIAWIDLRQYGHRQDVKPISFGFVLDSIAKAADTSSEIPSIGDPEVKAARVRELLGSIPSLLVLDNYEGLLASPEEEEKVVRFVASLPIGPSSDEQLPFIRVLITTRIVSSTLAQLPVYNERLESLPFKDSLKMMKAQPDAPRLTTWQWKHVWETLHGLPKYMQVAVGQLKKMAFSDWKQMVTRIRWRPEESDKYFYDLFTFSWDNPFIISDDLKRILLAITYFVGHARPEELRKTSGLSKDRFQKALLGSYNAPYVEVARMGVDREYYTTHPLMYAFCRAALNSEEYLNFRMESSIRFVDCSLDFAKEATEKNQLHLLDEEAENILAAARVGGQLESWGKLIEFRRYIANFLRIRGYWVQYREIVELTIKACRTLLRDETLAECLVYDLAWYHLRLEDVQTARRFINEGFQIFEKLQHRPGIAQAKRHLGKAALLDGLDEQYKPNESAKGYFTQAEKYYKESLSIRNQLQKEGDDQRLALADLKLDFGRLYWLQGIKYEQDGRLRQNAILLETALKKYEEANSISEEARSEFEQMSLSENVAKGRIAKAWGNQGNATKEIASYMAGNCKLADAKKYADAAKFYYEKNLLLGEEISKKDEISHALAGLAEVSVIESSRIDPSMQTEKRKSLLEEAKEDAQIAHRLYEELAGPRGQMISEQGGPAKKTRDEIRTEQLIDEIDCYLRGLHPGGL